jgi:hypothetical protein
MTRPVMHGAQFAKEYVNSYLQQDIPIRMIRYRNAWNVDDVQLPTPTSFFTYEPLAMDTWPTIITMAMSTTKFDRIGYDSDDPLYRVTYSMRTYIWVRSDHHAHVTLSRDRLTTVVRSALLDYPCLKALDEGNSFKVMIDEGTIREEFSDITLLKGDRVLAGSYLSYDLSIDEVVTREPIGIASNIDTTVTSLPFLPPNNDVH